MAKLNIITKIIECQYFDEFIGSLTKYALTPAFVRYIHYKMENQNDIIFYISVSDLQIFSQIVSNVYTVSQPLQMPLHTIFDFGKYTIDTDLIKSLLDDFDKFAHILYDKKNNYIVFKTRFNNHDNDIFISKIVLIYADLKKCNIIHNNNIDKAYFQTHDKYLISAKTYVDDFNNIIKHVTNIYDGNNCNYNSHNCHNNHNNYNNNDNNNHKNNNSNSNSNSNNNSNNNTNSNNYFANNDSYKNSINEINMTNCKTIYNENENENENGNKNKIVYKTINSKKVNETISNSIIDDKKNINNAIDNEKNNNDITIVNNTTVNTTVNTTDNNNINNNNGNDDTVNNDVEYYFDYTRDNNIIDNVQNNKNEQNIQNIQNIQNKLSETKQTQHNKQCIDEQQKKRKILLNLCIKISEGINEYKKKIIEIKNTINDHIEFNNSIDNDKNILLKTQLIHQYESIINEQNKKRKMLLGLCDKCGSDIEVLEKMNE